MSRHRLPGRYCKFCKRMGGTPFFWNREHIYAHARCLAKQKRASTTQEK